jgi:hypothetical protein
MTFISLGSNCSVAYQLNKYDYRYEAYPFDFAKTGLNKLISVLETDFKDYTNIEIIKKSVNHKYIDKNIITDMASYIVKNYYGIQFAHEIMEKDIDEFKIKLLRRIERFKKLKNPTFIRIETQKFKRDNYIIKMEELIKKLEFYFDNFKLIIISDIPIIHEKITWIKLKDYTKDWTYSEIVDWKNLFDLYSIT